MSNRRGLEVSTLTLAMMLAHGCGGQSGAESVSIADAMRSAAVNTQPTAQSPIVTGTSGSANGVADTGQAGGGPVETGQGETSSAFFALGSPIPGLGGAQQADFNAGRQEFVTRERIEDGLGPVFNAGSCVDCHRAGAAGGASADIGVSRVSRIGGTVNGQYSDLVNVGGAVIQARSLRDLIANYPINGEVVPREATFVSRRITTPLFGAGLIEAIPEATILSRAGVSQGDGVMGAANFVFNPITRRTELGRFGWKSQVSSLIVFSGDAYLNEMGITSPAFPTENLPQGRPIPPGADRVADPEDDGTAVRLVAEFMRFLAPPPNTVVSSTIARRGATVFGAIRCTSCHVPTMQTGTHSVAALSNKPVNLYSDLLLHNMGAGLADGIRQSRATGEQFRTAPLWGLGSRNIFLHDGRARTLEDAILLHGGEATTIRNRYATLSATDKQAIREFLIRL